jgi:hypothetical protein
MRIPFELCFWVITLLGICGIAIGNEATHFSLCPLDQLGFPWCPGCGLGRSMKLFLTGAFKASFAMHPLGGFAVLVIVLRIIELIRNLIKWKHYGKRAKASS